MQGNLQLFAETGAGIDAGTLSGAATARLAAAATTGA